jgi:hypothetical protein
MCAKLGTSAGGVAVATVVAVELLTVAEVGMADGRGAFGVIVGGVDGIAGMQAEASRPSTRVKRRERWMHIG